MGIELYNPNKNKVKLVWVHQLFRQEFDENGSLINTTLLKGYITDSKPQKKKIKKIYKMNLDEGVEIR